MLARAGIAATAAAAAPDEVRDRARELLASGRYQTELPQAPEPPRPLDLDLAWLGPVLRIALWIAVAAAVLVAAAWLWRRLRPPAADVATPEGAPAPAPAAIPTAGAEALAAEGRFGEAIHRLLLDTLAALSHAARLAPSLTSREIVARVPLQPPARDALAGLVSAVERSRFGGEEPGEGEYRACVARFHAFLASRRGAA